MLANGFVELNPGLRVQVDAVHAAGVIPLLGLTARYDCQRQAFVANAQSIVFAPGAHPVQTASPATDPAVAAAAPSSSDAGATTSSGAPHPPHEHPAQPAASPAQPAANAAPVRKSPMSFMASGPKPSSGVPERPPATTPPPVAHSAQPASSAPVVGAGRTPFSGLRTQATTRPAALPTRATRPAFSAAGPSDEDIPF